MNTENVKVRIHEKENKTILTIKRATKEDDATYICKATSEIGMETTRAKLHVDTVSELGRPKPDDTIKEEEKLETKETKEPKKHEEKPKKKKSELKKAKEIKEKIKAERIKIEKDEIREEKILPKEQTEEKLVILHCIYLTIILLRYTLNLFHLQII